MTALTLRGLAARKLRTALTAIAVVLGVALISGTYILTDTINKSFDSIFATANKNVDVAVTPREAVDAGDSGSTPAFRVSVLPRVQRVGHADRWRRRWERGVLRHPDPRRGRPLADRAQRARKRWKESGR